MTTSLDLSAEEFAERLVAFAPPPQPKQMLSGGVPASRNRWHRVARTYPYNRPVASAAIKLTARTAGYDYILHRSELCHIN